MMLAHTEDIQADLIGQLDLIDEIAKSRRLVRSANVRECIDTDFHQLT